MACNSCYKSWDREFDKIVSTKNKVQEININQLKLKVTETYKNDEEITTKFKPSNVKDVINKTYLDEIFFSNR